MHFPHQPVLLKEVLELFHQSYQATKATKAPRSYQSSQSYQSHQSSQSYQNSQSCSSPHPPQEEGEPPSQPDPQSHPEVLGSSLRYLDLTFGRGGHLRVLFEHFPGLQALALDADPEAIAYGKKTFASLVKEKRLCFRQANYSSFLPQGQAPFHFILMDLGLSSPQLEKAERGFSFYQKGPLDMRINPEEGTLCAKEVLETFSQKDLIQLFQVLGEQRNPHRVVEAIVRQRKTQPLSTTADLARLVEKHEKKRGSRGSLHPATLYFLALRLYVNRELQHLQECLKNLLPQALVPGGRLIVISFHSLEDRIVKKSFQEAARRKGLGKASRSPMLASPGEILSNPRSRSAKLRYFDRTLSFDRAF